MAKLRSAYSIPRRYQGSRLITGSVLRVRLGPLRGGRIALRQVHAPQVDEQGCDRAPLEPVRVGEPAVEPGREQIGLGRRASRSNDDRPRTGAGSCARAWTRTSHRVKGSHTRLGMRCPSVRTARSSASDDAAMSPRLKASSPSTPSMRASAYRLRRQGPGPLELFGGLGVAAAQHQHPAQLLGDAAPGVPVGRRRPAPRSGTAARPPRATAGRGLVGGSQRVRQGPFGLARGVEVEGEVEEAGGVPLLEQHGRSLVQRRRSSASISSSSVSRILS